MYKARAWLVMLSLECLVGEERSALELGVRRGRGHGVVYIGARASTPKKSIIAPPIPMIHRSVIGSGSSLQRMGASRAMGSAATPQAPPLVTCFRLDSYACMQMQDMPVLRLDSIGSVHDRARCA
jgi:hypothetical protein